MEIYRKWNSDIEMRVLEALDNSPEPDFDWRKWAS
jgi:hypothetical protein